MQKTSLIFIFLLIFKIISATQLIFLIHGINSSPKDFKKMETAFKSYDYKVINFGYHSKVYTVNQIADNFLKRKIASVSQNDTINFITHSLGAIVLRAYLRDNKPKNIGKIVMIAPPNQGSEVANFFKDFFLYKIFYHKSGASLSYNGIKKLALPNCDNYFCGIIAGTHTQLPFFSIFIKGEDDGKISVERTKLKGMKDFITLPYPHDTILKKQETIIQCKEFIKNGKFKHN